MIRGLERSRLPRPFREFKAGGYFIDFAWPDVLLGVEVHGAKWHRRRARWAEDLSRHNELTAAGWTILHFTWEEIRDSSARVVAEIEATFERLSLRLGLNIR
jgi:very-short-patch-repair endonuclease